MSHAPEPMHASNSGLGIGTYAASTLSPKAPLQKTTRAAFLGSVCWVGLASASGIAAAAADQNVAPRSQTSVFAHRDAQFLVPGQRNSSVAYLSDASACDQHQPLLVLLHGINESMTLYPWFGGTHDLRPMLGALAHDGDRAFVVAAPTQTRNAWLASTLWADFQVDAFVADLEGALPLECRIDRRAVYVAGHSAAGCYPGSGLAAISGAKSSIALAGVAFVDTCFEPKVADAVAAGNSRKVWVLWQDQSWHRSPSRFLERLRGSGDAELRITELQLTDPNPHVGAMYASVEKIVAEWLLAPAARATKLRRSEVPPSEASDGATAGEEPQER